MILITTSHRDTLGEADTGNIFSELVILGLSLGRFRVRNLYALSWHSGHNLQVITWLCLYENSGFQSVTYVNYIVSQAIHP